MAIEVVEGKRVRVRFDGAKCIHSRGCVLSRPDVFVPNVKGEWIFPDRASDAELAELAHQCPSGAIRVETLDGVELEAPPQVNTVRIRENGPLAFHAPLRIGNDQPAPRATLCRCGASRNKPYCDGSHVAAGFAATGEPATGELAKLERRDGEVTVEPQKDGPLKVQGALEIVTGTGRTIARVTETWLCRCGQSLRKPYCDGSHRRAGFRADA